MAIKAPAWCEHAIPTSRGWVDPITGEVYKSGGFTPEQISTWRPVHHENDPMPETLEENVDEPVIQTLTEAPIGDKSLDEMTKLELEALGRTHGVELDRRKSKKSLLGQVKNLFE
jgi:hypothetical protein